MKPLSILYVDDDDDIRTIVAMSLSLDPTLHLALASSAAEALALVDGGLRPDVFLLDVTMPDIDGPTLQARLAERPQVAGVPIVFMTANGRTADVASYREQGALGVIVKPFDPITLASRIRALVTLGDDAWTRSRPSQRAS